VPLRRETLASLWARLRGVGGAAEEGEEAEEDGEGEGEEEGDGAEMMMAQAADL
jgi:hypothetical protein